MIQHEVIAIDEGHATLLHIDEHDQSKNWFCPILDASKLSDDYGTACILPVRWLACARRI